MADAERAHITATLRETNWVIGGERGAAAQLGLPRTTLIARMQRLGISGATLRGRSGQPARGMVRVLGEHRSHTGGDSAADLQFVEAASDPGISSAA